jgi:peroxiredoxin
VAIVLAGSVLGVMHYKLKPAPTDRELRATAQGMIDSTEWRGHFAPDFELRTTNGDHFKLSENVGKKMIVLNFFATWCEPCRAEMPELNRYFNQHKSEPFLLLAVDAAEQQDKVDGFFHELKLDFPSGIDQGAIQRQYGVSSFPTTVVIGVDGKIQFYESGELANADVAFDRFLQTNRQMLQLGQNISTQAYHLQAEKQPTLPSQRAEEKTEDPYKLDERGKRIVAHMDCPCGCDKKVQGCTCNTSNNIKKALANEDFKNQPDAEIMKALNKRFCSGDM